MEDQSNLAILSHTLTHLNKPQFDGPSLLLPCVVNLTRNKIKEMGKQNNNTIIFNILQYFTIVLFKSNQQLAN